MFKQIIIGFILILSLGCERSFEPIENVSEVTLVYEGNGLIRGTPYVFIGFPDGRNYQNADLINWNHPVTLRDITFTIERLYDFNKEPYTATIAFDSLHTYIVKDTIEASDGVVTIKTYDVNKEIDFIGIAWHQGHSTYLNIKARVYALLKK